MKKTLAFLFCISFLFQCEEYSTSKKTERCETLKHHEPADEFYNQRSWPDASLDLQAYTAALHEAKAKFSQKNLLPGFDRPWTTRGPSNIGGRINTVAVHPQDHNIMYAGFATGGVFKTSNGGKNWAPIFDHQAFLSIGDIAIDPSNPSTIYVGTGDPNISGYPFLGDGIYKSEDAGQTWEHLGLLEQRIVSKIIIDPNESSTIYTACMGLPFERNNERGLYKSTDGGQSWSQILFSSEESGIIDIVLDPFDSNTLYAAAWDRIRNNQESIVSGPNAKIFKSIDAGQNWTILTGGLPEENMGRIGLTVSTLETNTLYAIYVDTDHSLHNIFKSVDGGLTWVPLLNWDSDPPLFEGLDPLAGFGWYFGKINLNPSIPGEIFIQGVDLWKSQNDGVDWERATPQWWEYSVHADKHDLVFAGTDTMILATDGGLYRGTENQTFWEDIESIAATQFYRVAYNPHEVNTYYGGAQDNGSTGGNNTEQEWARLYGGDGFQMIFHPNDPNIVYAETQRGGLVVTSDGLESGNWYGAAEGLDGDDRRNWDMPIIMSPHNPDVMYTGTYRVYANSTGSLPLWDTISTDLTDGLVFGSSFHSISTIYESPVEEGLLYVGTTDGNVWRTDFIGGEWFNISEGVPERYITDIKASPSDADRVFVSVSGYKYNEYNPHIFRSDDRGETWEDISGDLPELAINDIYILPEQGDLVVFAATDGGVYGTINGGENWERLGNNMPIIPIYDLEWNEFNNELIAGTHARSLMTFPLDSILTQPVSVSSINDEIGSLRLFPNPAVDEVNIEINGGLMDGDYQVLVLNIEGKVVIRRKLQTLGKIDLSGLSAGSYFVKVLQSERQWQGAILVQK